MKRPRKAAMKPKRIKLTKFEQSLIQGLREAKAGKLIPWEQAKRKLGL